jgi:hypothetical protein
MDLKNLKLDLPKNWREVSRSSNENQFYIKIYHIHPLSKVDPKITQNQLLPSPSPQVSITKVGVRVPGQPLQTFYDGMKACILSGFVPPEWTLQKLDNLWKQMTEGYHPGEGDFSADLSIVQYQTKEIARQLFKNIALMPTQGFNVPVPGDVKLLGLPENTTITELVESDVYGKMISQYISKEQLEKLRSEMKKVQKQIQEEVKPSFLKSGVKYEETKYLGCETIYVESKNPAPPSKPKALPRKTSGVGGGGGYDDSLDPLPKISQSYAEKTVIYQAMLIKNFVITGSLLWTVASLPSGDTPCYSLTQTKKKITTMKEDGQVFTDIAIVPVVSNYAKEGYLYKEEVEEILKTVIKKLT